jgi:hypothetical protein
MPELTRQHGKAAHECATNAEEMKVHAGLP